MSTVTVTNLTFGYEGSYDDVFEDVSFQFDTDWKLGFVSRNGRGKTTFLRLLMGEYAYAGSISASVEFSYFPFPVADASVNTLDIIDAACGEYEFWELCRELNLLEVPEDVLFRSFDSLSFGERTKTLMAAMFLKENRFLLLDEPTNQLDLKGKHLIAKYLAGKKGFLLVSHDRALLDAVTDHTLSINRTNIEIQSGSFSQWLENKERQDHFEAAENRKLKKDIDRMKSAARQTSDWSAKVEATKTGNGPVDRGFISHKAAKMMKRSKTLESRQQDAIEKKSSLLQNVETVGTLKLSPLAHHSDTLVQVTDLSVDYGSVIAGIGPQSTDNVIAGIGPQSTDSVIAGIGPQSTDTVIAGADPQSTVPVIDSSVSYDSVIAGIGPQSTDTAVFSGLSFSVKKGDRLALTGGNGSGKSSVLKLLIGEDIPHTGTVRISSGVTISYVSQDTSQLLGDMKSYAAEAGIDYTLFLAILRNFGLERVHFERALEELSEGQKKKILIARSLAESAHLYIWDEPLNFIDIPSRMQIEELLLKYEPTMIFVEHDEVFTNKVSTRTIAL
jgi:lincosamide and streptogramin A transport system ATP-binding/permease protein